MSKAPSFHWEILFSHSRPENIDRCLPLSLGRARIHLCTRCVGLYPSLVVSLIARLSEPSIPRWLDFFLSLVVPIVGASAWGLEQGGLNVSKLPRLLSGLLLGIGLGWVIGFHLLHPWPPELIELTGALTLILVLGMVTRFIRSSKDQVHLILPIDLTEVQEDKKTDLPSKNEVDP